jgi:hypothetical protein
VSGFLHETHAGNLHEEGGSCGVRHFRASIGNWKNRSGEQMEICAGLNIGNSPPMSSIISEFYLLFRLMF